MAREGGDSEALASTRSESGDTGDAAEQGDVSHLLGGLLIELGRKVQEAGVEGIRILTADELDEGRLDWFRAGWDEHARATDSPADPRERPGATDHPPTEPPIPTPGRLLRFPGREEGAGEVLRPSGTDTHPLPLVGAGEANVRDLMPHRPRPARGRPREGGREHVRGSEPD
ncbi:hypothetical protein EOT10_09775 [Streptomyces antnestii]|uniref:Uncharacterized protein n=1 Tax=Streptomyces antnestii TaxID=2494256 RepID=A0A437PYW4_9ACTN|nr:hypothetical protein [Streptomyces sp. San01]RVU27442.1 hypothetical protein EOT10_09775 [Streptomyces sp. San01]